MVTQRRRRRLSDLSGLPWPLPSDSYHTDEFQDRVKSAAAAARRCLEEAASLAAGDPASAVGIFDDLVARCRGGFQQLRVLVRSAASSRPEGEVWFAIGSAALAVGRPELVSQFAHHLADTDEPDSRLARKVGAPPRGARAQHLLARAATKGSRAAGKFAENAEALYIEAGLETPPDLAALLPATTATARGQRRLEWVPVGLAWPLVRLTMSTPHQHALVAHIRGQQHVVTHEEMGMVDQRNGGPNERWNLLQDLARGNGEVEIPPPPRRQALERQVQHLANELRGLFRIDDEPFVRERVESKRYWSSRFEIDLASEISFDDGIDTPRGDAADDSPF